MGHFYYIGGNSDIMITKIKSFLFFVLLLCMIITFSMVTKYYSDRIVFDSVSYDAKRNRISADSSIITSNDLLSDDSSVKWAKRSVTFTFNTGVEEYLIGISTNGFLVAKRIK